MGVCYMREMRAAQAHTGLQKLACISKQTLFHSNPLQAHCNQITPSNECGLCDRTNPILRAISDASSRHLRSGKPHNSSLLFQMEREGIADERVDLLPLTAGNREHLETYSQMDISLDPWPYAGTTTTCESLYMGVPVVSLAGKLFVRQQATWLMQCIPLIASRLCNIEQIYRIA